MNSKDIVNSVNIFNDTHVMKSNFKEYYWDEQCFLRVFLGWSVFFVHSVKNITHPNFQVQLECMNSNKQSHLFKGPIEYSWHIPRSWNQPKWLNNIMALLCGPLKYQFIILKSCMCYLKVLIVVHMSVIRNIYLVSYGILCHYGNFLDNIT